MALTTMINNKTGEVGWFRPDQVASRLSSGWRVAGSSQPEEKKTVKGKVKPKETPKAEDAITAELKRKAEAGIPVTNPANFSEWFNLANQYEEERSAGSGGSSNIIVIAVVAVLALFLIK